MGPDLVHAAEALADGGYAPVPMRLRPQKKPARKGWRDAAKAANPAKARALFRATPWAEGIAIATGEDVTVIDLDRGHGDGADGLATFAALAGRHGGIEKTGPRVRTPRGGVHLWFKTPAGTVIRSRAGVAPGVDVRGDAGLALLPPTPGYAWINPLGPLPGMPGWLLELVVQRQQRPHSVQSQWRRRAYQREPFARCAIVDDILGRAATARPGARNGALFVASAKLGAAAAGGWVSFACAAERLRAAAAASGLADDDGWASVDATIASGLKRGAQTPWTRRGGARRL